MSKLYWKRIEAVFAFECPTNVIDMKKLLYWTIKGIHPEVSVTQFKNILNIDDLPKRGKTQATTSRNDKCNTERTQTSFCKRLSLIMWT